MLDTGRRLQVWKDVEIVVGERAARARALFDPGSSVTVMGYAALEGLLGKVEVRRLSKPREVVLANGQKILIDAYVDSKITVDGYVMEERIYLSKDLVRKALVEGKELRMPDLIVGAPTMEMWGIELDLKKGDVIVRGGGFLL